MTFLISMLFISAISFSLITIIRSFASSRSRIVEIIKLEHSNTPLAPKIRVGEIRNYKASPLTSAQDAVVITFPRKTNSTVSAEHRILPKAA